MPAPLCEKKKSPDSDWPATVSVRPVAPIRSVCTGMLGVLESPSSSNGAVDVFISSRSVPAKVTPGTFSATVPLSVPAMPPFPTRNDAEPFVIVSRSVVPVPRRSVTLLATIRVVAGRLLDREVAAERLARDDELYARAEDADERPGGQVERERAARRR